jgi:hypothetical protein
MSIFISFLSLKMKKRNDFCLPYVKIALSLEVSETGQNNADGTCRISCLTEIQKRGNP